MKKSFKDIIKKLDIDESLHKITKKPKHFNRFNISVVPEPDFNYMSDLLMLPKTKEGYRYLLVIMDLATKEFDIEPLKTKEPKDLLQAYKKMIKRDIIVIPEVSFKNDGGTEFKGIFNSFLEQNKILHKTSLPGRHTSQAPVEALNRSLGRLIMGYLNSKSEKHNKVYKEWVEIINTIREELNEYRYVDPKDLTKFQNTNHLFKYNVPKSKFNVGDIVHYKLFEPVDLHGDKFTSKKFRMGDRTFSKDVKEISQVLEYPDQPYHRYKLHHMPRVSFTANELILSKEEKSEETFEIKKVIGKKKDRKDGLLYLVWWKKELKKDATWVKSKQLLEDDCGEYIQEYEDSVKK